MKVAHSLLCLLALAVPARAAVVHWQLPDGTTAALVEDHRVPDVTLRIVFPAGTWSPWMHEAHGEEAFRIQTHDPAGTLRKRSDLLAAGISILVGERTSELHAACLKEDLPEVLGLVRDVLANRDFDRQELRRRETTRKIQWDASCKEPSFRAWQSAALALFAPGDPRRRPWEAPEGIETDTAHLAATRDAIVRLPGRIVAFAGDMTRAEVEEAARGLLPPASRDVPAGLEPAFEPLVPTGRRERETTVRMAKLTQVYFALGRESLPMGEADYPAYVVADHVLGGYFYSRLSTALRHEGGETYSAGTSSTGDSVPGLYVASTYTKTENAAVAEGKLREVLRVFHEKGITEEERATAVSYFRGRLPFSRQSPVQVLGRWLRERALGLPEGFLDALPERAAALRLDEINGFIARYYDPAHFSMVRVSR